MENEVDDSGGNFDQDSGYQSPFDWKLLDLCTTVITLVLLVITLCLNLSSIFTICCSRHPRRYGYFHLLILFSALNALYFVFKSVFLVIKSLDIIGVDPEPYQNALEPVTTMVPDILIWILGTSLLLLTAMTVDCLSVHSVQSRQIQKCLRAFVGVFAVLIGIGVAITTLIFKYKLIFEDLDLTTAARLLIVTSCYLLNFVLIPAFFIVIFGTVNWVTDLHSSRPIKRARKVERKLDHRICVLSIILLLLFLIMLIVSFSMDMKIHENEEESDVTKLVINIINIVVDFLFALYPIVFVSGMGRFCCCADTD